MININLGDTLKRCPKCGEEILNDNSKFCSKCGVELEMNNSKTNKLVDSANYAINQVVTQAKIEKNYIEYKLENDKTQVKGNEFIISEKIANAIDNITKEKQKKNGKKGNEKINSD